MGEVITATAWRHNMASKDKGGRSARKVAAKNPKEKRQDKKAKKTASVNKGKVV